jgi:chromosome partitioning protein
MGVDPSTIQKSVVNVLIEGGKIEDVIQETQVSGLRLAPCNYLMSFAERLLPERPNYETLLRKALRNLYFNFDYILFDCPPFLGAIVTNAMAVSNLLIIPTQAEYFSIHSLRNTMALIRKVRTDLNPQLTYRLLLTMVDGRNRIHRTLSEELHTRFGNGVLETVIQIDTKLRESTLAGVPITVHAPKSRSAEQYRALAQEIRKYVAETVA